MTKEIKLSSLSFNEIGIDGLIFHEYKWDKETKVLTHLIDGIETEKWSGPEARKELNKILRADQKKKEKEKQQIKKPVMIIPDNQLKLF